MSPLEPDGLYDQLQKAYKLSLENGLLDAAHFLKQEIKKMQTDFLSGVVKKEK